MWDLKSDYLQRKKAKRKFFLFYKNVKKKKRILITFLNNAMHPDEHMQS